MGKVMRQGMWPWRTAHPLLFHTPYFLGSWCKGLSIFAGNAPFIGPQPQVIISHDLYISPKDLYGWWWMPIVSLIWLSWASKRSCRSNQDYIIHIAILGSALRTHKALPLCLSWKVRASTFSNVTLPRLLPEKQKLFPIIHVPMLHQK